MQNGPVHIKKLFLIGTWGAMLPVLFQSVANIAFTAQDMAAILPAPILTSQYFPCSRCHALNDEAAGHSREAFHAAVRVLGHTEADYGCFDCHDKRDLDRLRLFNGSEIDITHSSQLCGQCHSTNYTLWQSGLHGKVIGQWNGPKKITPCTGCHDPHQPQYASQQPEPPPTHPEQTLRWRQ